MKRIFLHLCALGLMGTPSFAAAPQPKVVFILLDNIGQEWFGCYGSEEGCAPDIDRLAREGVRFQHCYTMPICGPSRTVLLTGRFGPDVMQEFALEFLRRHRERPFLFYYLLHLTYGQSFTQSVVRTPLNNGSESGLTARRNGRVVTGGLYTLTEAGGDVAKLANCPKQIPGGRTVPLADFRDALPTLCDLAGLSSPASVALDGKSCAAFLRGKAQANPHREWIFNQLHTMRVVRDERFKLYSDGRFFDANADPDEQHELKLPADIEAHAAREKLQRALASLPPDSPPPFPLRSQAVVKLRTAERAAHKP